MNGNNTSNGGGTAVSLPMHHHHNHYQQHPQHPQHPQMASNSPMIIPTAITTASNNPSNTPASAHNPSIPLRLLHIVPQTPMLQTLAAMNEATWLRIGELMILFLSPCIL